MLSGRRNLDTLATKDVAVYENAYYAHFLTKIYHLQIELKIALSTNKTSFFLFESLVVASMVLC